MRFLLDQNVPDSVAAVFKDRGHTVLYLRDVLATDSPDEVVAAFSEAEDAVLVSLDGDFRRIAPRIPDSQQRRFRRLSRIALRCNPIQAENRLSVAMSLIEAEYDIAQASHDPRMIVSIGNSFIRTER